MARTPRLALAFLSLALACGGGGSSGPSPNPPPPPPPAAVLPATVSIDAGDNQVAEPGTVLPVRAAVTVRSASGAPVSGVTVAFSVDSGGGSLAATSAVTNSSGSATAGDWTLGPNEGNNVLLVSVTGVTPVKIRAQGKFGPVRTLIANRALPAAGGTIKYSKPGDALDGLELVVPNLAYKTGSSWTIQSDTGTVVPVPAGFTQAGPVFVVSNGQGYADSAMTVTVPLAIPAANAVAPFFFDPATGALEGIPLIARSESTVSFASLHFSGDQLAAPAAAPAALRSAGGSAHASFGKVHIVFLQIPNAQLVGTYSTSFLPGQDDWEFPNRGSFLSPGGICAGMSMTALFYHYFVRSKGQPPLYRRYDKSFVNDWDNVQGIHLAGGVQYTGQLMWANTSTTIKQLGARAKNSTGVTADLLTATWLALTIKATGKPTMLDLKGPGAAHAVVVYKVTVTPGQVVASISNPNNPGQGQTVTYVNGVMTPMPVPVMVGEPPITFVQSYAWGVTTYVPLQAIQDHWALFIAGQAAGTWIPQSKFEVFDSVNRAWAPLTDTVKSTIDLLKVRFRCDQPGCVRKLNASPVDDQFTDILNGAGNVTLAPFTKPETGLTPGAAKFFAVGGAFSTFSTPSQAGFLDGKLFTVVYGAFVTSPRNLVGKPDTAYKLVASNGGLATATSKFVWDFGDGTPLQTVVGDSVVTHAYDTAGTYVIKTELRESAGKLVGTTSSGASIRQVNAKIVEPSGPFTVDVTYNYAYSLGGFPAGTKFRWDLHNGRYALNPVTLTNDSTRAITLSEQGTYKIKVTATAPDGTVLGTDSTTAVVTSPTYPWPLFEVTTLNLNPVAGSVQPFSAVASEPSNFFKTDTAFFNRILRNETRMYFIYVPKDTFNINGTALPGVGVHFLNHGGPVPKGGPTFFTGAWTALALWVRPGVCPTRPDDPSLAPAFTHPGSTLGGNIDGVWPMRAYIAILGGGCGNVNVVPTVAGEIHMSFGGTTASGSFKITYRKPGAQTGNNQAVDQFRWTLSGTFSAVRVR